MSRYLGDSGTSFHPRKRSPIGSTEMRVSSFQSPDSQATSGRRLMPRVLDRFYIENYGKLGSPAEISPSLIIGYHNTQVIPTVQLLYAASEISVMMAKGTCAKRKNASYFWWLKNK